MLNILINRLLRIHFDFNLKIFTCICEILINLYKKIILKDYKGFFILAIERIIIRVLKLLVNVKKFQ